MAQIRREESHVAIKSRAERFFDAYRNKPLFFPKMCPYIVKDMQLIKGDSISIGSVLSWTFFLAGSSSSQTSISVIEAIDEKNKSITYKVIDGDIKKLYSHYKYTVQAINNPGGRGSSVKSYLEYKKVNADVPDPAMYFDAAARFYKGIDAYLLKTT